MRPGALLHAHQPEVPRRRDLPGGGRVEAATIVPDPQHDFRDLEVQHDVDVSGRAMSDSVVDGLDADPVQLFPRSLTGELALPFAV